MHVATYGSLTFPEVMRALLARDFETEEISLRGFARYGLKGKRYPGLIAEDGGVVLGRIYFDLDPVSLRILDRFEDEIYDRIEIRIPTISRGLVEAKAYVIPASSSELLSGAPWSPTDFAQIHLADYLQMCEGFRSKLLSERAT